MKTKMILFAAAVQLMVQAAGAQTYSQLDSLPGCRFQVYYSQGNSERARQISQRVDQAIAYYEKLLDFTPTVTLLILSAEDWTKYTRYPLVYGMPHYTGDSTLVVAAHDNPFWKSFIPPPGQIAEELREPIQEAYTTDSGELSMQAFFDLLVVHELGHAFHFQAKLNMQRKWLAELYVNSLLHAYVAEIEPQSLPALTLVAKMVLQQGTKDLKYTSLEDVERLYYEIGKNHPNNYGWYQFRWHAAAAKIYDASGEQINRTWWNALRKQTEKVPDDELVLFLASEVGKSVADVMRYWDRDMLNYSAGDSKSPAEFSGQ